MLPNRIGLNFKKLIQYIWNSETEEHESESGSSLERVLEPLVEDETNPLEELVNETLEADEHLSSRRFDNIGQYSQAIAGPSKQQSSNDLMTQGIARRYDERPYDDFTLNELGRYSSSKCFDEMNVQLKVNRTFGSDELPTTTQILCRKMKNLLKTKVLPFLMTYILDKEETMSSRLRYFNNTAPDFEAHKEFDIDYKHIKQDIMANVYLCVEQQKKTQKGNDGGLYVGLPGNAYPLLQLARKSRFSEERSELLKTAVDLVSCCVGLATRTKSKDPSDECGFLLGKAGVYAISAAVFFEAGKDDLATDAINQYISVGSCVAPLTYASFGGDELFVGRAGYLCGALWLNRLFGREVISNSIINTICDAIVQSGSNYAESRNSRLPLLFHYYNTEYLGAAHGLSSILEMLLGCDTYLAANKEVEVDIKTSVDFFLKIQMTNGNFPSSIDEIGHDQGNNELVHWCHGAPGVVHLMLKAFLRWHEPKYLNSAIKCGELIWKRGLLRKGPGICHGVGGNGYVFLALYRATGDLMYLYRANEFAKFLKTEEFKKARVPDNPFSLYEGYAGTICFLADLMEPDNATFPFMEVM